MRFILMRFDDFSDINLMRFDDFSEIQISDIRPN